VTFIKKSPVDLRALESEVKQQYLQHYPTMQVLSVTLAPRSYLASLPKSYTLSLRKNDLRRDHGTFYIRFKDNRKLYFDYYISAMIDVIHSIKTLDRKTGLTPFNTTLRTIPFATLRKEPLTSIGTGDHRLRRKVKAGTPIGLRDVETSPLVKRADDVVVTMHSDGLFIEFPAVALEDGLLHDIIAIRKHNGQRLKAKVTGPNSVEID